MLVGRDRRARRWDESFGRPGGPSLPIKEKKGGGVVILPSLAAVDVLVLKQACVRETGDSDRSRPRTGRHPGQCHTWRDKCAYPGQGQNFSCRQHGRPYTARWRFSRDGERDNRDPKHNTRCLCHFETTLDPTN